MPFKQRSSMSRDYAETSIETGHNTHTTQQFIFSPKIAMRPQNFPLVINFLFSCSCPIFYGLKWYFTMVIFFLKPVGLSSTFSFLFDLENLLFFFQNPNQMWIFQQCITFCQVWPVWPCLVTLAFRSTKGGDLCTKRHRIWPQIM